MHEEGDPELERVIPQQALESVYEDEVHLSKTRRINNEGDFTSIRHREG
mgnify:CR=1 FL=1